MRNYRNNIMDLLENLLNKDSFTHADMLEVFKMYQELLGQHQLALQELALWKDRAGAFEPGHFYSTVPDQIAFDRLESQFSSPLPQTLQDIDLRPQEQLFWLERFKAFTGEYPFRDEETPPYRFYNANSYFAYADAVTLYCMLRELRPKRLIEVGSGFSSALILDTNEYFCDRSIQCTFIEPYTERLESLLRPEDRSACKILQTGVQDVDIEEFKALESGDILFIDSSHVSKLKSDVNHLFFEVLPALASGVYIHFHDILYPFEYPPSWIKLGFFWNEPYMLRSFLMNNNAYDIEFYISYLLEFYKPQLLDVSSEYDKGNGGGSIWLRKR
jgi:hypothetical protein